MVQNREHLHDIRARFGGLFKSVNKITNPRHDAVIVGFDRRECVAQSKHARGHRPVNRTQSEKELSQKVIKHTGSNERTMLQAPLQGIRQGWPTPVLENVCRIPPPAASNPREPPS